MKTKHIKRWRRGLRLKMAPVGSRRDQWLRAKFRSWGKLRQSTWQGLAYQLLPSFISRPLRVKARQRRVVAAQPYRDQLETILSDHREASQTIIFPPSLDWNVQLFQRPQQLALALADLGALVFYLLPKPDIHKEAFEQIQPRMYLCNLPVETFSLLESPLVYLLTWNRSYETAFRAPRIIYDYVDEIRVFDGNFQRMVRDHERLVRTSHLVLTTAAPLYQATQKLRPDAVLCPNGVDYTHFKMAQDRSASPLPDDLAPIVKRGKPIVGYYGALAEWFDYELVMALALRRSELSFVIIGPDYDGTMPPSLLDLPNLDWLGTKQYKNLPAYLAYFDVAMVPFLLNEITHATSPIKLFEYMAGGKPVIITPMEESMRYDGVIVADTPDSFSERIDQALALCSDKTYLKRIDQVARGSTWHVRAEQILSALGQLDKDFGLDLRPGNHPL